jgi:hypothetical protein
MLPSMNAALVACMQASTAPRAIKDVNDWWHSWRSLEAAGTEPAALSIAGGFAADRVGWAFASGYQAALRALIPGLPQATLAAFCVTEVEGNHPRHMRTTILAAHGRVFGRGLAHGMNELPRRYLSSTAAI